jgi:hypothetical protein
MRLRIAALGLTAPALLLGAHIALANHSWGNYHWARTANPLPLMIGDNVSATWEPHLSQASSDWNVSSVLSTTIVPGKSKAQTCKPTAGSLVAHSTRSSNTHILKSPVKSSKRRETVLCGLFTNITTPTARAAISATRCE